MTRRKKEEMSYLVVKDNDLIQKARYNLTGQEQKLVMYAISKVKPEDKDFSWLEIGVAEFCDIAGINKTKAYHEFKNMIDNLDNKSFWVKMPDKAFKFRWFSEAEYMEGQGKIRVMLNSNLKKHIIGLRQNFTQYELWNVLALKGKYSLRLFEWFKSYSYQSAITINVADLRDLLMIDSNTYTAFKDFERRVIKPAVEEITNNTELNVSYEKVKKGRSVDSLTFHIAQKDSWGRYEKFKELVERTEKKTNQIEGQMDITDFIAE